MSKIKKLLKKVGKAALLGGGAYMAAKGLTGKSKNADVEGARGANLRGILKSAMPKNLSKSAGPYKDSVGLGMNRDKFKNFYDDSAGQNLKSGGSAGKKSKPKSIGKALRGGGKVMR